jgi:hypothetical protein
VYPSTLKMKVIASFLQTTWLYNPEDCILFSWYCENLRSTKGPLHAMSARTLCFLALVMYYVFLQNKRPHFTSIQKKWQNYCFRYPMF